MKTVDYNGIGGWGGWDHFPDRSEVTARRAKTGLWILLAVISSLFFLFMLAFMLRSQLGDWEHLSAPWMPLADPWQLYTNTFMLACGSLCLYWAQRATRRNNLKAVVEALCLSGVFTGGFLIGQLWVWRELVSLGYYVSSNPANSFFYLLTGLHGLHLLGGMVAWFNTTRKAWRGGVSPEQLSLSVVLCARYWHYLLALWLVLLLLLTSSPEAYAAFARWCGFQ